MKARYLKLTAAILLILYTLLLLYWMFAGFGRTHRAGDIYSYNFKPFVTVRMYLFHSHHIRSSLINIIGNIGVFVPFGVALPFLFRWRFRLFLTVILVNLLMLELLQLVTRRGSFDVDDVILNTLGAVIGWSLYGLIMRKWNQSLMSP